MVPPCLRAPLPRQSGHRTAQSPRDPIVYKGPQTGCALCFLLLPPQPATLPSHACLHHAHPQLAGTPPLPRPGAPLLLYDAHLAINDSFTLGPGDPSPLRSAHAASRTSARPRQPSLVVVVFLQVVRPRSILALAPIELALVVFANGRTSWPTDGASQGLCGRVGRERGVAPARARRRRQVADARVHELRDKGC